MSVPHCVATLASIVTVVSAQFADVRRRLLTLHIERARNDGVIDVAEEQAGSAVNAPHVTPIPYVLCHQRATARLERLTAVVDGDSKVVVDIAVAVAE